jgi:hypothetical protein
LLIAIDKVAMYIENSKHITEQNSQALVKMARMCESEAKRKEQLINVCSSMTLNDSKSINKM